MQSNITRNKIYFEHQSNDRLCGVHCLNSLLQGPFFDEIQLAEIGQQLDKMEKELMGDSPELINPDDKKAFANCDETGNYNITVLSEALKVYGAEISPLKQKDTEKLLMEQIDQIEAFIFNSSTHWFSIRKIDNVWYNFNSTNEGPGPQIISDFYLGAFLKGTEDIGFTNFLVSKLPPMTSLDDEIYKNLHHYQRLVTIEAIKSFVPKKINMGDGDERELEKAIALSKKEYVNEGGNLDEIAKNDEMHYVNIGYDQNNNFDNENNEEDDDMAMIMKMSMDQFFDDLAKTLPIEPSENEPFYYLTIKNHLKPNEVYTRRFKPEDKVRDVVIFAKVKLRRNNNIIMTTFTEGKTLFDENMTLKETEMSPEEILIVKND